MSEERTPEDLPMWWSDYLTLIERAFLPGADAADLKRAKDEMSAAARAAVAHHHRLLACLGMRQPGEQAPFEAWAKANGYDTRTIGPRYNSQRTKDAERGWMARGHPALATNAAPEVPRG